MKSASMTSNKDANAYIEGSNLRRLNGRLAKSTVSNLASLSDRVSDIINLPSVRQPELE